MYFEFTFHFSLCIFDRPASEGRYAQLIAPPFVFRRMPFDLHDSRYLNSISSTQTFRSWRMRKISCYGHWQGLCDDAKARQ